VPDRHAPYRFTAHRKYRFVLCKNAVEARGAHVFHSHLPVQNAGMFTSAVRGPVPCPPSQHHAYDRKRSYAAFASSSWYSYPRSIRNCSNASSSATGLRRPRARDRSRRVIAVVEQRDVPPATQRVEELQQCPGALGELEAAHSFGARRRAHVPHHVANVQLRHLVVGEISRLVALGAQPRDDGVGVTARLRRQAYEDVRLVARAQPVVELGDDAPTERRTERRNAPGRSGIVTATSASRAWPRRRARRRTASARSSCWRREHRNERAGGAGCSPSQRFRPATTGRPLAPSPCACHRTRP